LRRFLKKPLGVVFIGCLVLFTILAFLAAGNHTLPGDEVVGNWVSGINSPLFKWLMEFVSALGETAVATVVVIALVIVLLCFGKKLEALFVATLPLIGALLNSGFKVLVDRPRPGDDPLGGGLSFPSGHTTFTVMLFGLLVFLAPKLIKNRRAVTLVQVFSLIFILLMGISRIYLEAHWLSDTLGSLLLGGMILAPAVAIYDNYRRREEKTGVAGTA